MFRKQREDLGVPISRTAQGYPSIYPCFSVSYICGTLFGKEGTDVMQGPAHGGAGVKKTESPVCRLTEAYAAP